MIQHQDEAIKRAWRQFSKSVENGTSDRNWLEYSQHERRTVGYCRAYVLAVWWMILNAGTMDDEPGTGMVSLTLGTRLRMQ